MIEQQLVELKDILLAVHRKVANIEMQQRNPCSTCYYKNTHPKPAIPMTLPADCACGCAPEVTKYKPTPPGWGGPLDPPAGSPETANKFQGESGPEFVIPVVDTDPPVTIKTNSLVERVFSRKDKSDPPPTHSEGGQK